MDCSMALIVYKMSKCEHGQRITRFCVAEHCRHKESGGCDYCIKKHHFHLTSTPLLSEVDLQTIIRTLTLPPDGKYKSKPLQDLACEYLRVVKQAFANWLQQAQSTIAQKLSYPLLRREGLLPTYQRLKSKDYRKLNAQDLRAIHDFSSSTSSEGYKKQQLNAYFAEVEQVANIIHSVEGLAQVLSRLPLLSHEPPLPAPPISSKLSQIFTEVLREKGRYEVQVGKPEKQPPTLKTESYKLEQLMKESSLLKNRISRELSSKEQKQPKDAREQREVKEERKRGSTPIKELFLDVINKRPTNNGTNSFNKEIMTSPNKESAEQPNIYETTEEKDKRQRKRKASIDDRLDMKFGLFEKDKQSKQVQMKKRLLLDTIFKESSREDNDAKDVVVGELQNSMIPAPPPSHFPNDTVFRNKVVKIPIQMPKAYQQFDDQIQSPIFKNKRKQGKHNTTDTPLKELPLTEVIEVQKEDSQKEIAHQAQKNSKVEEEDIFLQNNQKNSLLLFCQALKSDSERAIVLLTASLKYSPNNLSAAQYLSYLYLEGGRAKQCLEVCQSILSQIQNKSQEFEVTLHLHNNRAAALNMLGRYSQSIVVLQKCLKFKRKNYFFKNLADAYFSLGIPQKAAMNYEKAVRLDPGYDQAYYNLAVCQFLQSQYMAAQLNIEQAISIDPANETYLQLKQQLNTRIANCGQ